MAKSSSKILQKYSDQELVEAFFLCWNDGDPDDIKSSVFALIQRFGGTQLAQATGIPRTTLYDMCTDKGNPTLENLCRLIHYLRAYQVA